MKRRLAEISAALQAAAPPAWHESPLRPYAGNSDVGRAAVQFHARAQFALEDTVLEVPIATVLLVAAEWMQVAGACDVPTRFAELASAAQAVQAANGATPNGAVHGE